MSGGGEGDLPAALVFSLAQAMTPQLFDLPLGPEGFAYRENLVTPREERALLEALEALPFEPFQFQGFEGRRRVVSYGLRYDFNGGGLTPAEPIPDWLLPMRERAAGFAGVPPDALVQVLLNEYREGAPIGWHRDRPVFDKVVGVSLKSPTILRFRRRDGARWQRSAVVLAPRSVYVLDGPARREWEHSIPEAKDHRFSVTFRSLRDV